MERITRSEAIDAGLNRYFTGIPCINGHVNYRYTSSSTCYGCVKDSSAKSRERTKGFGNRAERRKFKEQTKKIVLRCVAADVRQLVDLALTFARNRCKAAMERDVLPSPKGYFASGGAANYYFYAHPDDERFLRNVADALYKAHAPQVDLHAARQVAMLAGAAMVAPPPLPDGVDSIR